MKHLPLALLIILYSCQKSDTSTNIITPPPTPIDSTTTLGIQKEVFGTTVHTWKYKLDANNNRIFFAVNRNSTGADEFYVTDVKAIP